MSYLLDSNVCIRLINNSSIAVSNRLASCKPADIFVSTVTQLELYYGAYRSIQKEKNIEVLQGNAPECFADLPLKPDRINIGGGKSIKEILLQGWDQLPLEGRLVATANNLENLYQISETLAHVRACNIEVVQSSLNRLEKRGLSQVFASVAPIFILSGEKIST